MSRETVHKGLTDCVRCPRLVEWRERQATEKRPAYADQVYWGRPVPSLGSLRARILVVGLAPAAHGGNRTGRMFTGDRSGEWVFRAMHRAGLSTTPLHTDPDLNLVGCRITAICHCAPPDNRPAGDEVGTCVETWMVPEIKTMEPSVVVALGGLAWTTILRYGPVWGWTVPRPRPPFGHLSEVALDGGPVLLGSYHPSQQNTFTGRLTERMFDEVWERATVVAGSRGCWHESPTSGSGPTVIPSVL